MSKKPIRLSQRDPKKHLAFCVSVSLAVLVIVVGWVFSIRGAILEGVITMQGHIDVSLDKAAEGIVELTTETNEIKEFGQELGEDYELFKETYENEKQKQEAINQIAEEVIDKIESEETH